MLFLKEDLNKLNSISEEELQKDIQEYINWVEELSKKGHFKQGDPLENDRIIIDNKLQARTDGPFIETKELISGYFIIFAESADQATNIAKGCPVLKAGGTIELRKILVLN